LGTADVTWRRIVYVTVKTVKFRVVTPCFHAAGNKHFADNFCLNLRDWNEWS